MQGPRTPRVLHCRAGSSNAVPLMAAVLMAACLACAQAQGVFLDPPPACTTTPKWKATYGLSTRNHQTISGSEAEAKAGQVMKTAYTYLDGTETKVAALYAAPASGTSKPGSRHSVGLSLSRYVTAFNQNNQDGYILKFVNGATINGVDTYTAFWEKNTPFVSYFSMVNMDAKVLKDAMDTHPASAGWTMVSISGYGGDSPKFAAVWHLVSSKHEVFFDLSSAEYQKMFNDRTSKGLLPTIVNGYKAGGKVAYAGIFVPANGVSLSASHGVPASSYQCHYDTMVGSGYMLKHINSYVGLDNALYLSVLWHLVGFSLKDAIAVDNQIHGFMTKYSIPTLSFTLAQDGRIVFTKAYGPQDFNNPSAGPACPSSLFRVASLSKSITAATIHKLIEQGRLSLGSKVFGPGALLGTTYGAKPYKKYVQDITIEHLLLHTAGGNEWDNNGDDGTGDPMFDHPDYSQAQIISWVLDTRTITEPPGTVYAYSNFGYSVLGRVIEAITRQGYTQWTNDNYLKPCGATSAVMAGDTLAQRKAKEVTYKDAGFSPYGMKVTRMDAHGGWAMTSMDVTRHSLCMDGITPKPYPMESVKVLSNATVDSMRKGSDPNPGYGHGISFRDTTFWHTGALPGTAAELVGNAYQPGKDVFTWSILANSREGPDSLFADLDALGWQVTGEVSRWPCYNLVSDNRLSSGGSLAVYLR